MQLIKRFVSLLAAVLMFSLMSLTVIDVAGRTLFRHPLLGATELTEIALVLLSFLMFPIVALTNRHIVADVADVFESRVLDWLQVVLTAGLGAAFFGLIAWRLWVLASQAAAYADSSVSLQIPMAPILYVISVLSGVTAIAFALGVTRRPVSRARAEPPDDAVTDSIL